MLTGQSGCGGDKERGTVAPVSNDGAPSREPCPGKSPPLVFRPKAPLTICAKIVMGRVVITFLTCAPGDLFKRTDRLGPYLLIGDQGAIKPYQVLP